MNPSTLALARFAQPPNGSFFWYILEEHPISMQIPRRKSDELRRRDPGPLPITEEGLILLRKKLAGIKASLPDLSAEAQRTADFGDRSDNAAYKEAKGRLRRANWQVLEIEDQIKRAEVIVIKENTSGTIQLGATVLLEKNGERITFQILGPHETDPSKGRISHRSPLGAALLGRQRGDFVTIQTANGPQEYKVIEIN